jgi:hypothetical protein
LRNNNILPPQEESKAKNLDKSDAVVKKFTSLQNTLVSQNSRHHESIKGFIKEFKFKIAEK